MQVVSKRFSQVHDTINSRPEMHEYYKNYVEAYIELYKEVKQVYSRLSQITKIPAPNLAV
jgi:hypothetical protein